MVAETNTDWSRTPLRFTHDPPGAPANIEFLRKIKIDLMYDRNAFTLGKTRADMDADPIASFKYALSGDLLVLYGLVIIGFIIRGFADFPFPVASEFLFHTVSMAVTVIGSIFVVGGVVGVIRYVCVDTLS